MLSTAAKWRSSPTVVRFRLSSLMVYSTICPSGYCRPRNKSVRGTLGGAVCCFCDTFLVFFLLLRFLFFFAPWAVSLSITLAWHRLTIVVLYVSSKLRDIVIVVVAVFILTFENALKQSSRRGWFRWIDNSDCSVCWGPWRVSACLSFLHPFEFTDHQDLDDDLLEIWTPWLFQSDGHQVFKALLVSVLVISGAARSWRLDALVKVGSNNTIPFWSLPHGAPLRTTSMHSALKIAQSGWLPLHDKQNISGLVHSQCVQLPWSSGCQVLIFAGCWPYLHTFRPVFYFDELYHRAGQSQNPSLACLLVTSEFRYSWNVRDWTPSSGWNPKIP